MPAVQLGLGLWVRNRFRLGPQLAKTAFFDLQAELVSQSVCAFVFPPVETLEDRSLRTVAGIVLKDDKLARRQLAFHPQGRHHFLRLLQTIRRQRRDAFGAQVFDNLPVPHGNRAKGTGQDQDRELDLLKMSQAAIRFAEDLREDDCLGRRQRRGLGGRARAAQRQRRSIRGYDSAERQSRHHDRDRNRGEPSEASSDHPASTVATICRNTSTLLATAASSSA